MRRLNLKRLSSRVSPENLHTVGKHQDKSLISPRFMLTNRENPDIMYITIEKQTTKDYIMYLRKLGKNETELTKQDGTQYFFSYETLVAVRTISTVYVTKNKTATTTKHVNKWLEGLKFETVTQAQLFETFK